MEIIKGKSMEEVYKRAIREVYLYGEDVSPRGSKTKELAPATIVVEDARLLLAAPPSRKINPCFGIAETLWFLRGSNDLEEIAHYNSVWRYFEDCDNRGILNGAYGKRLRNWKGIDQIEEIYNKLKKDPYSRQAIAVIFDPVEDNRIRCHGGYSKDVPCTSYFNFHIRNNKLNLHVVMRSNDLHKGFIYDAHNFMLIQNIIAGWLGVEVGKYTHTASSLHIYKEDMDNMLEVLNDEEYIYEEGDKLHTIGVDKETFEYIIEIIEYIESITRSMVDCSEGIKLEKLRKAILKSKLLRMYDFWYGVANCLIVYNARKARIPKSKWEDLAKYEITNEYRKIFEDLSDLSNK